MGKDTDLYVANKLINALGSEIRKSKMIMPKCKFCQSENVVRNGHRKGTQYWLCTSCGRGFVDNQAIPKNRYPVDIVGRALYNYYAGMSLNAICEGIRQDTGEPVTDTSVYNWLAKYTRIEIGCQ